MAYNYPYGCFAEEIEYFPAHAERILAMLSQIKRWLSHQTWLNNVKLLYCKTHTKRALVCAYRDWPILSITRRFTPSSPEVLFKSQQNSHTVTGSSLIFQKCERFGIWTYSHLYHNALMYLPQTLSKNTDSYFADFLNIPTHLCTRILHLTFSELKKFWLPQRPHSPTVRHVEEFSGGSMSGRTILRYFYK